MAYNNNLWGDDWNHNYVNPFSEETEKRTDRQAQTADSQPQTSHAAPQPQNTQTQYVSSAAAQSQRPTPQMRNQMMSPAYPQTQFLQRQTLPQTVPQFPQTAPGQKKKQPGFMTRKAGALLLAVCIVGSGAAGYFGGRMSGGTAVPAVSETSSGGTDAGATPTNTQLGGTLSVSEIAALASNSVVEVTTEVVQTGSFMQQYISEGAGSGVILSEDGYIATNNHVIEGARKITVRLKSGESYSASLVGTDAVTDVAVLKIDATGLSPVTFGDSASLEVGDTAVAIGNPLGTLGGTVTDGIISALDRDIILDGQTMTLLQTNAAINPGNSGGGLFNDKGELIGLVVAKSSGENVEGLGFAIPSNKVKEVVDELMSNGYVTGRVDTGMEFVDVDSVELAMYYRVSELGVYIQSVAENSNAEQAGFQAGDRVVAVNGTQVESAEDITAALQNAQIGDTVQFTLSRNGRTGALNLILSEQNGAQAA